MKLVRSKKADGFNASSTFILCTVKRLIAINSIQNKSFCLHNICVRSVYIYYVQCPPKVLEQ